VAAVAVALGLILLGLSFPGWAMMLLGASMAVRAMASRLLNRRDGEYDCMAMGVGIWFKVFTMIGLFFDVWRCEI
jgi:purine-cytosine permease-like protein